MIMVWTCVEENVDPIEWKLLTKSSPIHIPLLPICEPKTGDANFIDKIKKSIFFNNQVIGNMPIIISYQLLIWIQSLNMTITEYQQRNNTVLENSNAD